MSHDKIEVTWEVADGYVGNRPQRTKISHSEIADCSTEDEVKELVADCIREDFEQRISPDFGESVYSGPLELWREMQADREDERRKESEMEGRILRRRLHVDG